MPYDPIFQQAAASMPGRAYPGTPDFSIGQNMADRQIALLRGMGGFRKKLSDLYFQTQTVDPFNEQVRMMKPGFSDWAALGVNALNAWQRRKNSRQSQNEWQMLQDSSLGNLPTSLLDLGVQRA